jgi:hypothetical protein
MRIEVKTYIKAADHLRAGDNILTPRLTIVEIEQVLPSHDTSGRLCFHVTIVGDSAIYCFLETETVLVIE